MFGTQDKEIYPIISAPAIFPIVSIESTG